MPSLKFVRYEELTKDQEAKLPVFEETNRISPVGFGEPGIQYGYLEGNEIVAWLWSAVTLNGFAELHVAVNAAHRGQSLATRLGVRYFLEENGNLAGYRFVVTSAPLRDTLRRLGFSPSPVQGVFQTESAPLETQEGDEEEIESTVEDLASTVADDGWERAPFTASGLAELQGLADHLQAQAPNLTLPTPEFDGRVDAHEDLGEQAAAERLQASRGHQTCEHGDHTVVQASEVTIDGVETRHDAADESDE